MKINTLTNENMELKQTISELKLKLQTSETCANTGFTANANVQAAANSKVISPLADVDISPDEFPPLPTFAEKLKHLPPNNGLTLLPLSRPTYFPPGNDLTLLPLTRPTQTKPDKSLPRRPVLQGRKPSQDCRLKSNKRKSAVFVGGLSMNTEATDIVEHLNECGIEDVECYKLKAKDKSGRAYKSAAYKIVFHQRFKDIIYNSDNWPEDSTIREWVYMDKPAGGHGGDEGAVAGSGRMPSLPENRNLLNYNGEEI